MVKPTYREQEYPVTSWTGYSRKAAEILGQELTARQCTLLMQGYIKGLAVEECVRRYMS
jgi:hypothetical protein